MNKIILFLCHVNHWYEVQKSKFRKPIVLKNRRPSLPVINKMLLASINQSNTYWQLEVCEKYFKEYAYEYRNDLNIENFKRGILSQLQHQRTSIQIQASKLSSSL